ncbi:putative prolipoprotein diacylglyceryl transferase [Corynebacterium efficiens YS-314]|uniref:Phosphatidylglycerol--prolipoprotein diacylglyceryl transferase n=1 Tax=Corynebacterium efficiens (strain DSM 44549 / YS-314 / AJ 12310 / JCM 11189 / NBRC 100395) TaxID=196164 RepID=LGT_COREF|nr:prolipoprotein diacylglyceryl transferase [Corynebacterium efficiens]Q8FP03.1 RecName: Full=Phosphatidylglycerol--prolipoprotein diacylglyceryl transferase [Corynebacterium efficiens YS-314]BAC18800.1 putative prolipoprotein diacylglyceryl transferase [Corynebacterium efficiens YS-314]
MDVMTLAAIPSPPQGVWYLGPLPIRAYAMCIIAGIIVAIWLTRKRYAARGGNPEVVLDAAIVAVPAGIIGGRIYHVITDNQKYFCETCDPVDALKITNGGLGIWGAVILGGLAVWAYFRYKKIPLAPFADAVAPGVILAQAIGRLGNWFNQELYGAETDVPWALEIYYRVDENGRFAPVTGVSTGEVIATVHPTFLYEMLWNLLIFGLLIWADRRFRLGHGRVFALYVAGYTLGRFWIEQMRTDEATMVFGMRINTLVSAVVFILAVIVFLRLGKGREAPAEVDPAYHAAQAERDDTETAGLDATTGTVPGDSPETTGKKRK